MASAHYASEHEAAQYIDDAQSAGKPSVITVGRAGAKNRRKETGSLLIIA
jgi:hypothetical protein